MKKYKIFIDHKLNNDVEYEFFECTELSNMPGTINAVLSITMIGDAFVMTKKTSGWWDIPGGKLEKGESLEECIYRENVEELGVHINISSLKLIGYVRAKNSNDSAVEEKFSSTNYMPIYIGFVNRVDRNWSNNDLETTERGIFSFNKLSGLLINRKDGGQLREILTYANTYLKSLDLSYIFTFIDEDKMQNLDNSPVTQVMVFCKDLNNQYCIVKDYDEDHYSLPGGGCELNEDPLEGIKRELFEEAQIIGKNFNILGTVKVDLCSKEKIIASTQHYRYTCDVDEIKEFIPRANGFEVESRTFVSKDELFEKVMLLNNPTGVLILEKL